MNRVQYMLSQLERPEYIEDTKRIVKVCLDNGVVLSLIEAEELWEKYSNEQAASWLILPKDDEVLWKCIISDEWVDY